MKRKEEKENKIVIEDKMESRSRRRKRPTCDFALERKRKLASKVMIGMTKVGEGRPASRVETSKVEEEHLAVEEEKESRGERTRRRRRWLTSTTVTRLSSVDLDFNDSFRFESEEEDLFGDDDHGNNHETRRGNSIVATGITNDDLKEDLSDDEGVFLTDDEDEGELFELNIEEETTQRKSCELSKLRR